MPANWVKRRTEVQASLEASPARIAAAERALQKARADFEKLLKQAEARGIIIADTKFEFGHRACLLYTSPSPRD